MKKWQRGLPVMLVRKRFHFRNLVHEVVQNLVNLYPSRLFPPPPTRYKYCILHIE